jgi:hypothetical protein
MNPPKLECFQCGEEITSVADYIVCCLRDRLNKDASASFHPTCFDKFKEDKDSPGSLGFLYRIVAQEVVTPSTKGR